MGFGFLLCGNRKNALAQDEWLMLAKCPVMKCPSEGFYAGVPQRHRLPFSKAFLTTGTQPESFAGFPQRHGIGDVRLCYLSKGCYQFWSKTFTHTRQTLYRVWDSGRLSRCTWISVHSGNMFFQIFELTKEHS